MKRQLIEIYILGMILFFALGAVWGALHAQTYILNPQKADTTSIAALPLSEKDHNQWIQTFLMRTPIDSQLDRQKIKDGAGENLDTQLKRAAQDYLELKIQEAAEQADEALNLIALQWPYAGMQKDVQEIYALKIMVSDSENSAPPFETLSFADRPEFQSNLPIKFQTILSTQPSKVASLTSKQLGVEFDRALVFGREVKPPLSLRTGRWLVHLLKDDHLSAFWISVNAEPNQNPVVEKLWTRSIWKNIPHPTLKAQLLVARPAHLSKGGITVMVKEEGQMPSPLLVSSSARDSGAKDSIDPHSWPENFSTDIRSEEEPSIFRSPWFWIIAGTVAGVGGYFAIQSSQSHSAPTR